MTRVSISSVVVLPVVDLGRYVYDPFMHTSHHLSRVPSAAISVESPFCYEICYESVHILIHRETLDGVLKSEVNLTVCCTPIICLTATVQIGYVVLPVKFDAGK